MLRALQQSFETNVFLQPSASAQVIKLPHTGEGSHPERMHMPQHKKTHKKKLSHRSAWPALLPKPFPLICRRAPCLLVMRTGREAGPSSLPAPLGQAACANLSCVSNDANSLAQKD